MKQHINKICFNSTKSCYFKIVSYTSHILQYYLYYLKDNTTPSQLTYKAWRKYNINNKFYHDIDTTLFPEIESSFYRQNKQRDFRDEQIYNKFYNIIDVLENEEMKTDLKLILSYTKARIFCGSGISLGLP